jgi:hypothetical protein
LRSRSDLVFLHGPAAAGKLTVGRELAEILGVRLFHNHLVVDALLAVFEFGSKPFVELREKIWTSVFREAARENVSLVFTFTPERTVRPGFVSDAIEAVESEGGRVRFVELTCPLEVIESRVESESRAGFAKLRSAALFRELQRTGAFEYPPLPEPVVSVDTSLCSPREAATRIAKALRSAK